MTDEIAMGFRREPLYAAYLATDSSAHPRSILIIEGNTSDCHEDTFWRTALESPGARNFSMKFIPWHESEQNYIKLDTSVKTFYNSLDEYEYTVLWSQLKLTLEQINWYRHNARKVARSVLHAQYPSTLAEALQLDGEFLPITQPVAQIGCITQQPRHKQAGMHTRCETEHTPNILITSLLAKTYTLPGVAFYANPIATPSFVLESDSCGNFSDRTEKFIGSAASAPVLSKNIITHTISSQKVGDYSEVQKMPTRLAFLIGSTGSVQKNKDNFPNCPISSSPAETPLSHVTTNVRNSLDFPNKSNGYFTDNLIFNNPSQDTNFIVPTAPVSVHTEHSENDCHQHLTAAASVPVLSKNIITHTVSSPKVEDSNEVQKMTTRLAFLIGCTSFVQKKGRMNLTTHSTSPAETPLPHVTTNVRNFLDFTNKSNSYFTDNLIFNSPSQDTNFIPSTTPVSAHLEHSESDSQPWLTATASAQDFAPDTSSDLNLDLGLILDSNWASDLDSKLALNWVSDLASKLASKNNFPNHHVSTTPAETPLPHVTTNVQNFLYFPNKSNSYFTDNLNFNPNHKYSDFASAPPLTKGRPVIMASLSPPQDPA